MAENTFVMKSISSKVRCDFQVKLLRFFADPHQQRRYVTERFIMSFKGHCPRYTKERSGVRQHLITQSEEFLLILGTKEGDIKEEAHGSIRTS